VSAYGCWSGELDSRTDGFDGAPTIGDVYLDKPWISCLHCHFNGSLIVSFPFFRLIIVCVAQSDV